jgi:ABC-type transport system involved in multi-copper enzyme maturation permease subunit
MRGTLRAEWLRFRKRRALQILVIAVPVLIAFFYLAGFRNATSFTPYFDEAEARQELINEGVVSGLPPDQIEEQLRQMLDSERLNYEQQLAQVRATESGYAFPQSLLVVLGSATYAFLALILLTATTIGDEFSWGTIRTMLLASSDRRRLLTGRFISLGVVAGFVFGITLLLGAVLPLILAATGSVLPPAPPVDLGWLGLLILANLIISVVVISFAAMATTLVRSGAVTLVIALVYVAVEGVTNALLLRFDPFQDVDPVAGTGALKWTLDLLPFRAILTVLDKLSGAAGRVEPYPGAFGPPDPGATTVPLVALVVWGAVFMAIGFWRFRRMDIVE